MNHLKLLFALLSIAALLVGCGYYKEGTVRCMDGQTLTGRLVIYELTYEIDTGDGRQHEFPKASCSVSYKVMRAQ